MLQNSHIIKITPRHAKLTHQQCRGVSARACLPAEREKQRDRKEIPIHFAVIAAAAGYAKIGIYEFLKQQNRERDTHKKATKSNTLAIAFLLFLHCQFSDKMRERVERSQWDMQRGGEGEAN